MKIIAVTGGIGSGKSTVCREFFELGAIVIDADRVGHSVLNKAALHDITAVFGESVLNSEGNVDRSKLGQIVFADAKKLEILNAITHKHIFEEIQNTIDKCTNSDIIVLDTAVIFTTKFPIKYDYSIVVTADEAVRTSRVVSRDGKSAEDVKKRIKSQISDNEFLSRADFVIENNGSLGELKCRAEHVYQSIISNKIKEQEY